MNVALEDTREEREDGERRLGKVVVRGSNIVSISFK